MAFSWFRARELGVPWFSMGGSPKERAMAKERKRRRLVVAQMKAETRERKAKGVVQPAVFNELHALTHSEEAANRLVDYAQSMNPGRDRVWCIEKAIYDIKRDRMA